LEIKRLTARWEHLTWLGVKYSLPEWDIFLIFIICWEVLLVNRLVFHSGQIYLLVQLGDLFLHFKTFKDLHRASGTTYASPNIRFTI
jgi:hypothetical protein